MHDAVSRRNDIDILESRFGPINKVKSVIVTTVFDRSIFCEGIGFKARVFNREGMINNELGGDDRVNLSRITSLGGYSIA